MALFNVMSVYFIIKISVPSIHIKEYKAQCLQIAEFLSPKNWPFFILLSFSHDVMLQPAEIFEFEGNVYSHHLSPIARKHSLIAGVWSQWCSVHQIELFTLSFACGEAFSLGQKSHYWHSLSLLTSEQCTGCFCTTLCRHHSNPITSVIFPML